MSHWQRGSYAFEVRPQSLSVPAYGNWPCPADNAFWFRIEQRLAASETSPSASVETG